MRTHGARADRERHRLPFDPIEEAARQWATHWGEMPRMRAVTSLMRVHQLVLTELDELLRPLGLTFARYEVLVLLSFSRRGALPLGKIGERLQVHATSVTPLVKRLEAAEPDPAYAPPRGRPRRSGLDHPAGPGRDGPGDRGHRHRPLRARFDERGGLRSADRAADPAARGRRRLLTATHVQPATSLPPSAHESRITGTKSRTGTDFEDSALRDVVGERIAHASTNRHGGSALGWI